MKSASASQELDPVGPVGLQPRPTKLSGLVEHDDVDRHRSLLCDCYDACLDEAFRHRWASWTCERCPLFRFAEGYRAMRVDHEGGLRPDA